MRNSVDRAKDQQAIEFLETRVERTRSYPDNTDITLGVTAGTLRRLLYLAQVGLEVEDMPANSSLSRQPMQEIKGFPTGTFPWTFSRVGELDSCAQNALDALTFHRIPIGEPIPEQEGDQNVQQ